MAEGMVWLAVSCILLLLLVGLQAYFYLFRPYHNKVRELKEAAEESKQAEHIRREFVANVSHELKTPLTSISGFIETLQAGAAEDPEIRSRFIDIIAIETSRLKRLIEDLLVLSDIENKRETEDKEFDVNEAIERTVEVLKPIAEEKDIPYSARVGSRPASVGICGPVSSDDAQSHRECHQVFLPGSEDLGTCIKKRIGYRSQRQGRGNWHRAGASSEIV